MQPTETVSTNSNTTGKACLIRLDRAPRGAVNALDMNNAEVTRVPLEKVLPNTVASSMDFAQSYVYQDTAAGGFVTPVLSIFKLIQGIQPPDRYLSKIDESDLP